MGEKPGPNLSSAIATAFFVSDVAPNKGNRSCCLSSGMIKFEFVGMRTNLFLSCLVFFAGCSGGQRNSVLYPEHVGDISPDPTKSSIALENSFISIRNLLHGQSLLILN